MSLGFSRGFWILTSAILTTVASSVHAVTDSPSGDRYFGGLLDHRSRYGQDFFPEPLRAPETDVDRELRFDWLHAEQPGTRINEVTAELEYNFDLLTMELEVPYETSKVDGE